MNRLRTLSVSNLQSQILNSYTYNLRASGHRRQIVEASGRTATHAYDDLYRLTGETITADPTGRNGSVSYDLDAVGNRLSRTSQISNLTSQIGRTYNARDWLDGDTYDANGNTTNGLLSLGTASTDVYDFENRLILRIKGDGSQINLSYDADGNRLQKSLFDAQSSLLATHYYLVDANNHTGYAQVVEERTTTATGTTLKTYTYGADLISVVKSDLGLPTTDLRYYLYDGLGSVRALTDTTGAITDTYTYDAFGNLLAKTGTTDNAYLYRGEQWDADLGLYYNRARFLNPDSGRFWSMDSYEGSRQDPLSLHKYLYAQADPVRFNDPSGHMSLGELNVVMAISLTLSYMASPAPLNAPGPGDPTYGDTSGFDLAINIIGAKIIGDFILEPLFKAVGYSVQRVGNYLFSRPTTQIAGQAAASGLGSEVAATFESSMYRKIVTTTKTIVYRAENAGFTKPGRWFGTARPTSAIDAEELYNITKHANNAIRLATYEIPPGTTIYIGRVAGGAGEQIFIANPSLAGVTLIADEPLLVGLKGFGL